MIELKVQIRGKSVIVSDEQGRQLLVYENIFEQLESEHTKQDLINILKSFLLSCPYSNGDSE